MVDTIRTQTELLTTLFQDGQPDRSITAQDIRDLIVSLRANEGGGWGFWVDSQQTDPGSDNLSTGVRTKITCDGASTSPTSQLGELNTLANITPALWDTSSSILTPDLDGDSYDVRLTFEYKASGPTSGQYIEFELDIGPGGIGTGPVVYKELRPVLKGSGTEQHFAFSIPIFAKEPFTSTGGSFFITSTVSARIYNVRLYVVRTYKPGA